ncbi:hypothetical protein BXT84_13740 [Sulfobacillus thermotolerans]|uniref:Ferredoxin n=1 Tax=Sulfobacillus thermotolerans TaxID=338644 RepID=A0ABN5H5P5_9FIRM|nr:hypothetical protein BXT84_13740 [Sulfobacillus thermotolerans]
MWPRGVKFVKQTGHISRRALFQSLWPIAPRPFSNALREDHTGSVRTKRVFRPPGAHSEDEFCELCTGCGRCAQVCPAQAISPDDEGLAAIMVNQRPCWACQDMPCIGACETGALHPLEASWQIQMGTAVIDIRRCWMTTSHPDCGEGCVTACPFPNSALQRRPGQAPEISRLVCIGCGRCVPACPPGAIQVVPR